MTKRELLAYILGATISTLAWWWTGIISTCEIIVCK